MTVTQLAERSFLTADICGYSYPVISSHKMVACKGGKDKGRNRDVF